ncbi:MAG: hypothetical protein R2710_20605 [Acidimicrobiales bacterium]
MTDELGVGAPALALGGCVRASDRGWFREADQGDDDGRDDEMGGRVEDSSTSDLTSTLGMSPTVATSRSKIAAMAHETATPSNTLGRNLMHLPQRDDG